jgi:hypothetical protein
MPAAKQMVARAMFVAEQDDGHTVVVLPGARFPATHPVVKANPGQFEPATRRAKAGA